MDEKRREEVQTIVSHFEDKEVSQNIITEFCNLNKIKPITMGDLTDYKEQVKHDKIAAELFPLILGELLRLQYKPEFAKEADRKRIDEENDEIRVNITKWFEAKGVRYQFVQPFAEEMGNLVGGKIAMAGTTAFNKATEVLLYIAAKHFKDNHFTMFQVARFAEEVFKQADIDKQNK